MNLNHVFYVDFTIRLDTNDVYQKIKDNKHFDRTLYDAPGIDRKSWLFVS